MKNLIIVIMGFIPIVSEIIFDRWCWRNGKDDKPISTWLRAGLFVLLAFISGFILPGNYWGVGFAAGMYFASFHLLLFNPSLNIARPDKTIGYRKEGEIWTRIPYIGEYFIKLVILYVFWAILFHWDWVEYEPPRKLVEYFMF